MAAMPQLRETLIPLYLNPVPGPRALTELFNAAGVPRFKSNPGAKRGGGTVYWSVAHVERLLRQRVLPGRLTVQPIASAKGGAR